MESKVHLELDPLEWGTSFDAPVTFFFEASRATPPRPPPSLDSWWRWAHQHGGEDVGLTSFVVTLQATRDVTVVIDPTHVEGHVRQPLPGGSIYGPEGVGGNGPPPHRFHIDLEANSVTTTFASGPNAPPQATPSFKMKRGDTDRIEISAWAERDRHSWFLSIPMIVNGKRISIRVNKRKPFTTVGRDGAEYRYWDPDREQWGRIDDQGQYVEDL